MIGRTIRARGIVSTVESVVGSRLGLEGRHVELDHGSQNPMTGRGAVQYGEIRDSSRRQEQGASDDDAQAPQGDATIAVDIATPKASLSKQTAFVSLVGVHIGQQAS